jgi:hypothetical protein
MGLFSKRTAPATAPAAHDEAIPEPVTSSTSPRRQGLGGRFGNFGRASGEAKVRRSRGSRGPLMGHLPSFGQWIKATALDLFTMFVMGAIGLGVSPLIYKVNNLCCQLATVG